MNIYRDLTGLPEFRNAIVTTGSFDGVHAGHQKILFKIRQLAAAYGGESVVITFDPHPREVIYPKDSTLRLLTSTEEKLSYLERYGMDNAVILPFTVEFSQLSAREYVESFLIKRFSPKCLVLGYDHRFGLNRAGNFELLRNYADQGAFNLVRIEKQEIDNITISSTKIRQAIANGDIKSANALLGHPYLIRGTVVHGQKLGAELGYPTANLKPDSAKKLLPKPGVYAAYVSLEETRCHGMLYIGTRPSIASTREEMSIEAHIFNFDKEIYGEKLDLELLDFVRDDKTFESLDALRTQIDEDRKVVESRIANDKLSKQPEVAVTVLNYNGRDVLERYLPSFINTQTEHTAIYLVDNGSTDDSVEFAEEEYPGVHVIRLPKNFGFAQGYNMAVDHLREKYLALVNSDVELTEGWLEPIIDLMESNPDIAVCQPKIRDAKNRHFFEYAGGCGGLMDILGYPFCIGRVLSEIEEDVGQYDMVREIFWSSGAAFVIRRELFELAGGFDGDYFAHQEEIDLCWTLKRAGYKIVAVPQSVIYHEGGAALPYDSPGKVFLNFRNNLATLCKHLPWPRLIVTIPLRLVLDTLAAVHFLTRRKSGNAWAVIRAYGMFLQWVPALLAKRRITSGRIRAMQISSPSFAGWLRRSILINFYLLGNRTFASITGERHAESETT